MTQARGAGEPQLAEEAALFGALLPSSHSSPRTVFVLGSPRTGSTVLYQALCAWLGCPFISNLTNDHYADRPIVGIALLKAVDREIRFNSRYGKTEGPFQPSEGSAVIGRWFGGGHPSEIVSASILDGMERHFVETLCATEALFGRPLVIKNPWNCFRVESLARLLPDARFVWIRRDIASSAKSDLHARYATKGTAYCWNSATPANVEELRTRPPVEQVVENQIEFARAIADGLSVYAPGRHIDVWYEDFCASPRAALDKLGGFLGLFPITGVPCPELAAPTKRWDLSTEELEAIDLFVEQQRGREHCQRWDSLHPAIRG